MKCDLIILCQKYYYETIPCFYFCLFDPLGMQ